MWLFLPSHLTLQTWAHKPPIDSSYIWVYPLSISISINHSARNQLRSHTQAQVHTHKHQNSDTLHCWWIDYQCGFYWRVWGADTSALGLLILLSYPNEPCVIHHCSAGNTQAAWMAGRTELRRDRDYHLATRYISMRVPWIPFWKASTVIKKGSHSCLSHAMWGFGIG